MFVLYNLLLLIIILFYLPWLVIKLIKGKYREGLKERVGIIPFDFKKCKSGSVIWIHAASVGEVMATKPLIENLKKEYPDIRLVLSTMTDTGRETARELDESVDCVFYFPLDLSWIVDKVLTKINPALIILIETELWPNFIRKAHKKGSKVMVVSGRIGDKSFSRYKYITPLMKKTLSKVDLFSMQSEKDARRIKRLGAPAERVFIDGNIKYDRDFTNMDFSEDELLQEYKLKKDTPIIVAGSTHEGEEKKLLETYQVLKKDQQDLVMFVAPRYIERAREIKKLFKDNNIKTVLRTKINERQPGKEDVIIVDTLGELTGLYGIADLVFVGGSLIPRGGHNILEAAAQGKAVFFGPYMFNFKKDVDFLLKEGAVIQVRDKKHLIEELHKYLNKPELRKAKGKKASKLIQKNRGAVAKIIERTEKLMESKKSPHILIIRLSAIGDVIHSLPVAEAVRKSYPEARISWIVEKKAYPLVELNPYLDEVILFPKFKWKEEFKANKISTIKSVMRYFRSIRNNYNFDFALDLHGLFKSSFTAYLSGAQKRFGPEDGRELSTLFYQKKLPIYQEKRHQVDRNLHLAKQFGADVSKVDFGLEINEDITYSMKKLINEFSFSLKEDIIVINPITTWQSKDWPIMKYAELTKKIVENKKAQVIFTGAPEDRKEIKKILEVNEKKENIFNLAGKTDLKQLAALYKKSMLFIGGDTGPMHLAAAVDVPVIALMGPTSPKTHGPYGEGNIVIQPKLDCINCWENECPRQRHYCMEEIKVDMVLKAVEELY